MIKGEALPTPQELGAEPPAYLNGLTEPLASCAGAAWICFAPATALRLNGCCIDG